jgi:hypothetical protein
MYYSIPFIGKAIEIVLKGKLLKRKSLISEASN